MGTQGAGLQRGPGLLRTDHEFSGLMETLIARYLAYSTSSSSSFLGFFAFLMISTVMGGGRMELVNVFLVSFFCFFGSLRL